MKKITTFLFALLLLAACTPEEQNQLEVETPFVEKQLVTITARVAGDEPSNLPGKHKVSGKDNGSKIELTWNEKDQILVNVDGKESVFTITKGAGTKVASFEGEMPAAGREYTAVYPVKYDEAVLDNQTYVENGFANGLVKMSTKNPGTVNEGFVMSADNSVLVLQLTGTHTLGTIVLTNTLTNKFYTLDCTDVVLNSSNLTSFYFVVPAGEWTRGFVVDVFDKEDKYITSFSKISGAKFVAAQSMVMPTKDVAPMAAYTGVGVFSVSATKQVSFAPGNLQYMPSRKIWRFAPDQTKIIGEYNKNLSDTYNGWVDLFGYSSATTNFGAITSTDNVGYWGDFIDWAVNTIGADAPNTWHSLSSAEWMYMISSRNNAANLCGLATVEDIHGAIILPDNWANPRGISFVPRVSREVSKFSDNILPFADWKLLEQEGAIFLPVTGQRTGNKVDAPSKNGFYWTSSGIKRFVLNEIHGLYTMDRAYCEGNAVRLAKELIDHDADSELEDILNNDGTWD